MPRHAAGKYAYGISDRSRFSLSFERYAKRMEWIPCGQR